MMIRVWKPLSRGDGIYFDTGGCGRFIIRKCRDGFALSRDGWDVGRIFPDIEAAKRYVETALPIIVDGHDERGQQRDREEAGERAMTSRAEAAHPGGPLASPPACGSCNSNQHERIPVLEIVNQRRLP
jgi:hypothetical protein